MDTSALDRIDEWLSESSVDGSIAGVIGEVEAYLAKHAAFDAFLAEQDYADAV